jgi:hypothetical protein
MTGDHNGTYSCLPYTRGTGPALEFTGYAASSRKRETIVMVQRLLCLEKGISQLRFKDLQGKDARGQRAKEVIVGKKLVLGRKTIMRSDRRKEKRDRMRERACLKQTTGWTFCDATRLL